MISLENKINIFEQELNEQVNEYRKTVLEETKEACELEEEKADVEIKKQNQSIKNRFARQEARNVTRIITQGKNEARQILIDTKKEIRNDFIETLKERITQLIGTPGYQKKIETSLSEVAEALEKGGTVTLFINEDEHKLYRDLIERILSGINVSFEELPKRKIGGFIIHDQDERISYDYSLENMIDENRMKLDTTLNEILNGAEN